MISKIKDLVGAKKLQGIADVKDLTDRQHGLRLVIEVKNGFHPEAVLEQLYKLTPMEESFGVNNVALVDGQPLTLGLKELLEVYVDHRFVGQGIGRALLPALVAAARDAGFHQMIAVIGGAEPASVALHAAAGFVEAGRMRRVGRKFGRELDTLYMQLELVC